MLGATLAGTALTHAMAVASVFAVVGRQVPWQRTDKFRRPGRGLHALGGVRTEIALAICSLAAAGAAVTALPRLGMTTMFALGLFMQGRFWLAAPVMALVAERDIAGRAPARPATAGATRRALALAGE